jgi:hypothetical protein
VEADIKKAGDALLPFVDVQSARHLLLKMKNQRPELEKIQIPLNEEEIRNREDLQEIIQEYSSPHTASTTAPRTVANQRGTALTLCRAILASRPK